MKKIITSCMLTVLTVVLVFSAAATSNSGDADINYSGVLDNDYEITDETEQSGEGSTRTAIANGLSYDKKTGLFYFYATGIATPFSSNVCNGMITKEMVKINIPDGVFVSLYRNGNPDQSDLGNIEKDGIYVLQFKTNDGVVENVISFTIVGDNTGLIDSFTAPDGFYIVSATRNGESISASGSVSMTEEGKYAIRYRCTSVDKDFSFNINVDHTPPRLALKEVSNGRAWGPVDISDLEENASVTVYRDGIKEKYNEVLTKSGKYTLVVRDDASNVTEYNFTIMIYFNSGSLLFLIVLALILAATVAYVVISKRRLKVR